MGDHIKQDLVLLRKIPHLWTGFLWMEILFNMLDGQGDTLHLLYIAVKGLWSLNIREMDWCNVITLLPLQLL